MFDPASIRARALPAREAESFHEQIAQQIQRAPWVLISMLVHGIVVTIFLLLPAQVLLRDEHKITMAPPEKVTDIPEPDPPPLEKLHDETPQDTPDLAENTITEVDTPHENDLPVDTDLQTAFEGLSDNPAIGLGGNAGRKGLGGRHGRRRGAPRPTQIVIQNGLAWLARHQDMDGRWDADGFAKHDTNGMPPCDGAGNPVHDIGLTGLALLAFLGDGNTMYAGPHQENVHRAVLWLREQQGENGLIGAAASHDFIYDHAIAALALVEAYGLSHSKILRHNAEAAVRYLESHRNPYAVWRYQPHSGDNDTSVTGWAVMVYKSARDFGITVDSQALQNARLWFDQMTDAAGRCGYNQRGGLSSRLAGDHATRFPPAKGETMTAVSLMCRFMLGQNPKDEPQMLRSADLILAKLPSWDESSGAIDHYYWYYATYALYQVGGARWKRWTKALSAAVVHTQRKDGNAKGSWNPAGVWGEDGGRVYSTATLVLTLEAYYRIARVFVR